MTSTEVFLEYVDYKRIVGALGGANPVSFAFFKRVMEQGGRTIEQEKCHVAQ